MQKLLITLLAVFSLNLQAAPDPADKYRCIIEPDAAGCNGGTSPPPLPDGKTFTNFIGMQFVSIPAGSFYMGSRKKIDTAKTQQSDAVPSEDDFWALINQNTQAQNKQDKIPSDIALDPKADNDELPLHKVEITQSFQMGVHEVTFGQFAQFLRGLGKQKVKKYDLLSEGFRKYNLYGKNAPVTYVSWDDAKRFIQWLNETKPSSDRATYRLPTEAEWEYAARAGSRKIYVFADDAKQLGQYAWFNENANGRPQPVGQKKPNAWGLYDMQGNVWEWVADGYSDSYYGVSPVKDPTGATSGQSRVLRGGSWVNVSNICRAAERNNLLPDIRNNNNGFRVVRLAPRT